MIINIDKVKFHLLLFLSVIVIELHFRKQKLGLIIVLNFKVSSFWHISNYLGRVRTCFCWTIGLAVNCQVSSLIFRICWLLSSLPFENAIS